MALFLGGMVIGLTATFFLHSKNEKKKNDLRLQYKKEKEKEDEENEGNPKEEPKCDQCGNKYYENYIKEKEKKDQ